MREQTRRWATAGVSGVVTVAALCVGGVGATATATAAEAAATTPGEAPGEGQAAAGTVQDPWEYTLRAHGTYTVDGEEAVTYDTELVPEGTTVTVEQFVDTDTDTMRIDLTVSGLRPGHTLGAHVHTEPCGPDPAAAGGHYQHHPGEEPWRANPYNEVWLDVTPDPAGVGVAVAWQRWLFREGGAGSLVLHEHATDETGDAGGRVACLTVPFVGLAGSGEA
ncbi:superoxide dismutase family protein [Streptomyces sp. 4N509B]|uniref:superoxide dismutase family protein n=1 Tax=Streptomyces sp. 4N509B TaxID=3457413 RepID=UPI003FD0C639